MATSERVRHLNQVTVRDGPVVYWCTAQRRMHHNHALDHAVACAEADGDGLVVVEALRPDYPYASPRFHAFIMQGMADNAAACADAGIPYVGHVQAASTPLLQDIAGWAGRIVTDDHPGSFYPHMLVAAGKLEVAIDAVEGCGITPLSVTPKPFTAAVHFRRWLQKRLPEDVMATPRPDPLRQAKAADLPRAFAKQYPDNHDADPRRLAPDGPAPVATQGGEAAAQQRWLTFLPRLPDYLQANHPDDEATSGLSPYLHFGHISSHQMVGDILDQEGWSPSHVADVGRGQREGWWGLSAAAEAFLDQLITWRELGFVEAYHRPDALGIDSLPTWAQETLAMHAQDPRHEVDLPALEAAASPDPVWNAAQRQLLEEGVIHNYLRMLWGKSILGWAPDPQTALDWMFYLNDKYALDGRDPNSVSGILWCLGRYDRAWQEREIFGKVRYMSSQNTVRKLRMKDYLARWG